MKSNYDVYLCRERNYSSVEADFKRIVFCEILDSSYGSCASLENIKEWIEVAWRRRLRQMRKEK